MTRPLNPMDDEMKCGSSRKSHELQIASAAWSMDELTSNMHLHILTESLVSYLGNGLGWVDFEIQEAQRVRHWVGGRVGYIVTDLPVVQ